MYFIGDDFQIEMVSGKHVVLICPTTIEDIKKLIIKEERIISLFDSNIMCDHVINNVLKIQQTDNVKVQKETSKFLKSNFLRNDDFLLLIKCEKPNCTGHLIINDGDLSTSKFISRTEEVDCYIVSVKQLKGV